MAHLEYESRSVSSEATCFSHHILLLPNSPFFLLTTSWYPKASNSTRGRLWTCMCVCICVCDWVCPYAYAHRCLFQWSCIPPLGGQRMSALKCMHMCHWTLCLLGEGTPGWNHSVSLGSQNSLVSSESNYHAPYGWLELGQHEWSNGGQPSIHFKWQMTQQFEMMSWMLPLYSLPKKKKWIFLF